MAQNAIRATQIWSGLLNKWSFIGSDFLEKFNDISSTSRLKYSPHPPFLNHPQNVFLEIYTCHTRTPFFQYPQVCFSVCVKLCYSQCLYFLYNPLLFPFCTRSLSLYITCFLLLFCFLLFPSLSEVQMFFYCSSYFPRRFWILHGGLI
jgi:hypothetical protein